MSVKNENPNKLKAEDVIARLRTRYADREYAFACQVSNATGSKAARWADACAMSLWPSRGLELEGFEVKVYRSDWKKELADPSKAEAVAQYCQRWWIVAAKGVVNVEEVPAGWGFMEEDGDGLRVKRQAPLNESAKPFTREFVAALLRRMSEASVPRQSIKAEIAKARKEGEDSGEWQRKHTDRDLRELKQKVADFKAKSGIDIEHDWRLEAKAEVIKVLSDARGYESIAKTLTGHANILRGMLKEHEAALKALGAPAEVSP